MCTVTYSVSALFTLLLCVMALYQLAKLAGAGRVFESLVQQQVLVRHLNILNRIYKKPVGKSVATINRCKLILSSKRKSTRF